MKPPAKFLFPLYAFIALADLLFIVMRRDDLRWFSKPLLMPVLMIVFYLLVAGEKRLSVYLILVALFLSWCGDVLLQAQDLFIPGLLSFLLAHLAYILYFRQAGKAQKGLLQMRPLLALPVLLYIALLVWLLFPYLGQLKVPVIIYSLAIGTMLLMALNTRQQLCQAASACFVAGALLFVVSDSLLAIHLFAVKNWVFGPFVMATYAAAQYLLVKGALAQEGRSKSPTGFKER